MTLSQYQDIMLNHISMICGSDSLLVKDIVSALSYLLTFDPFPGYPIRQQEWVS